MISAVVVVLALVGGGVTALLLRDDDKSGDSGTSAKERDKDDPDNPDEPDEPDEPAVEAGDYQAISDNLLSLGQEVFPAGSAPDPVQGWSWSVAPSNLDGSDRLELSGSALADATEWQIVFNDGSRGYWFYVEQLASDYLERRTQVGCDPDSPAGLYCRVHTTPGGATAYEQGYAYSGSGSRFVWIPGDDGRPEVSIAERVNDFSGEPTEAELDAAWTVSLDDMLAALDDERLQVPPPKVLPPLPSYSACVYTSTPPAGCPDLG